MSDLLNQISKSHSYSFS